MSNETKSPKLSERSVFTDPPPTDLPVRIIGIDWSDWGVGYFGKAKSATHPNEDYNAKECWRWCSTEDEIQNPPTRWKHIEP